MQSYEKKKMSINRVYTFLIISFPIFCQYRIASLSYVDLFNVVIGLLGIYHEKLNLKNRFVPYFIFELVVSILMSLTLSSIGTIILFKSLISFGFMFINIYCIAPKKFDFYLGYRYYSGIVYLSSVLIAFQYAIYFILKTKVSFLFPYIELNYNRSMSYSEYLSRTLSGSEFRPCSIFLEPNHLVIYILPWIFLSLFLTKDGIILKNMLKIAFVSIMVCLSTSSLGIVGCAVAWLLYLIRILHSKNKKLFLLVIPILIAVVIYISSMDEIKAQLYGKIVSLKSIRTGNVLMGSTPLRLIRGWLCFEQMDFVHQLFGSGYTNLQVYFNDYGIKTIVDDFTGVDTVFMNGIFTMLCRVGIVGSILYLVPFFHLFKRKKIMFPLLLCWFLLEVTSSAFDTPSFFVLLLFTIKTSSELDKGTFELFMSEKNVNGKFVNMTY